MLAADLVMVAIALLGTLAALSDLVPKTAGNPRWLPDGGANSA
jgi:hypothetical protein